MKKGNDINIAVIARPIDLLCIRQYIENFPLENFLVLLTPNNNRGEKEVLEYFEEYLKKDNVNLVKTKYFERPIVNVLFYLIRILLIKLKYSKINKVISSGSIKGRIAAKYLKFSKYIFTDEGNSSLTRFPIYIEKNKAYYKIRFNRLYWFFGINEISKNYDYEIFTIFKEIVDKSPKITFNDLSFWKKEFDKFHKEDAIYVLGCAYHIWKIDQNEYFEGLKEIKKDYQGKNIFYKRHRLEKNYNFKKEFGFEPLNTSLPVEYYCLLNKTKPEIIISFYSSAFTILQLIMPEVENLNLLNLKKNN